MTAKKKQQTDFEKQLTKAVDIANRQLRMLFAGLGEVEPNLYKALLYTIKSGGKRIRPAIVLWSCRAIEGKINKSAEIAAAAVEMVHTYSLVHDDLPAMDNDDLRRGKPTCHKAFDEATAILAGDALLTFAFEVLAEKIKDKKMAADLIVTLAKAAGAKGMIAGQSADLVAENKTPTEELVEYIHINKTAKIFEAAAKMGAIAGGATNGQLEALGQFGLKLGLAFQVADDLLDISSTSKQLGKTTGKDQKANKCTYPAVFGIEESKQKTKQLATQAVVALRRFDKKADILRELADVMTTRTN